MEADFLALYGIEDPWEMPTWRFFDLAMRTFHYQGTMTFRAMQEQDGDQDEGNDQGRNQGRGQGRGQGQGRGRDGDRPRERTYGPTPKGEVKDPVPLPALLAMMPGVGSYSQVKKTDSTSQGA